MTDIVGSTGRWAANESAMVQDLTHHDELLRGCVEAAGGRVVKGTGDGMIAVLDDPLDAVNVAAAVQGAVGTAGWLAMPMELRAAVHVGTVHERDGDVFGAAVNRAARILALASPGSVLVSGAAAGLLAERGVELRMLGSVLLRGFATPDVVYALVAPAVAVPEALAG